MRGKACGTVRVGVARVGYRSGSIGSITRVRLADKPTRDRPRPCRMRFVAAERRAALARRTGVTQSVMGTGAAGLSLFGPGRLAGWFAVLCLALSSSGCLLTKDLPDPALDILPASKQAGKKNPLDAPPTLDWWRKFRSRELTTLMEEAQTVNLDIAAATARFKQADAQVRITGAVLLPALQLNGSESYSRTS